MLEIHKLYGLSFFFNKDEIKVAWAKVIVRNLSVTSQYL